MFKITALIAMLTLGASASLADASPRRGYRIDRSARFDRFDRDGRDDFGPRRYRAEWVALGAPLDLCRGRVSLGVRDPGTFTQLRLQTPGGTARVDRVVVRFADGSTQVADVRGAIRDRMELALDGNNRQIDQILIFGDGAIQVFAI